ncbi:hypothetical protein JN01_0328 [Entomoplasma freundtii]|uniref:Uncharacterized protein n=1 Tax=Entomoplasma freundtii TaxID=74700 RepID=A0A2K8NQZ1_9MOLU|nr:hypothetical protein [Entomoplasma freundtii]ATZ16260.1 hypothetical protein EFREU_v1c02330 [Entomoplasma freundtii]TDY56839.1 hypothetical protein JN01_0328 [Entomoplasma freundtii]
MKKRAILVYVFLILWICVWTTVTGILVYFTGNKVYYICLTVVVLSFFNLVWWSFIKTQKRVLDKFTKLSFGLTLNLPAVLFAMGFRNKLVANEIKIHGSAKTLDLEKELAEQSLTDWEKLRIVEKLKRKRTNNRQKINPNFPEENLSILLQTYNQYLLAQILKQNPSLYDTYEINEKMKQSIGIDTLDLINLEKFIAVADDWTTFENQNAEQLMAFFTPLKPEQIFENHKLNRVDNIIFVRHKLNLPFE